jgi:hypothetical protein
MAVLYQRGQEAEAPTTDAAGQRDFLDARG